MVIKKARANHHNGTQFETLHYETQAKQVKVLGSSGDVVSDIDELLLKGKLVQSVSLTTVKDTGLYQVKNCIDAPFALSNDIFYLMSVESVGAITKQTFFDRANGNMYIRPMINGVAGEWIVLGKATRDAIRGIETDFIHFKENEFKDLDKVVAITKATVQSISSSVESLEHEMNNHRHDGTYLKLSGGNLSAKVSMANSQSYAGKNTSGADLNIGKIDGGNQVLLGDIGAKAVIQASGGDLKVSNGTTSYKVYHAGNDGTGSGMDADKLDGVEGSKYARTDVKSIFSEDVEVGNGSSVVLKAPLGSSATGDIFYKKGDGTQLGRLAVDTNGNMLFYTGGSILGHQIKATGEMYSTYGHMYDASEREIDIKFRASDSDKGMGFYFNNNTRQLGLYDWGSLKYYFTTNRDEGSVQFGNHIRIQDHRVYVQEVPPTRVEVGDVWFDI